MDALIELLETVRSKRLAHGRFRGLLHLLIGRQIAGPRGEPVGAGLTYRDAAALLKRVRWDPEDVRELGVDPESLPPRDRQRFWFLAICQAKVDGDAALAEAELLALALRAEGYRIAPPPGQRAAPEPLRQGRA